MHLCLFEDDHVRPLFPLTRTRAACDLRLGRRTLRERTCEAFGGPPTALHVPPRLAPVTAEAHDEAPPLPPPGEADVLFVNGRYVAEEGPLLERLRGAARPGEPVRAFIQDTSLVAAWVPAAHVRRAPDDFVTLEAVTAETFAGLPQERVEGARLIGRPWHVLDDLRATLRDDFEAQISTMQASGARASDVHVGVAEGAVVHEGARLVEPERIYIAPGAEVRPGALLSAIDGPIHLDRGAVVKEGAILRGSVYVGPGTVVKTGTNLEGCAFGPHCKVSGEVHDAILHGFSNKAHPGFLGNAYVGAWCNLGAGTNVSNLRNDYASISLYNAATGAFEDTGRQFVGLFMGDHAKCGIGTTFNTGTVVGPMCNLYGAGFPPRHVPPFSWGSPHEGFSEYRLEKALRVAEAVMARRGHVLTGAMRTLLTAISEDARE